MEKGGGKTIGGAPLEFSFAYNDFESLGAVLSESYYSHKDIPKEGAVVLIVVEAAID